MQNEKPRIGILLPTRSLVMGGQRPTNMALTLSMAETAEQAGLDSVWLGDSLTAKPRPEPVTALAALAARTRRVRLGTAVLLAALRHPVLLAHAVATVDLVAEGRTVLAVGVGGAFNDDQRQEWRNAGVDPTRRASRLEEMIQVIKPLTRGEEVTFKGKHFDLDSVRLEPPRWGTATSLSRTRPTSMRSWPTSLAAMPRRPAGIFTRWKPPST